MKISAAWWVGATKECSNCMNLIELESKDAEKLNISTGLITFPCPVCTRTMHILRKKDESGRTQ